MIGKAHRGQEFRSARIVVYLLATMMILFRSGGVVLAQESGTDLSLEIITFADPPFSRGRFFYGFGIRNQGPGTATGVLFTDEIPNGLTFGEIFVFDSLQGEYITDGIFTPNVGEGGTITVSIDELPAGGEIGIDLYLAVTAAPGESVVNTAMVASNTDDPRVDNNSVSVLYAVPIPPRIERVKALADPLRVVILGAGFSQSGFGNFPLVTIGDDFEPLERTYKTRNRIVLTGRRELRRLFPKRVPVRLNVTNPDGGTASFTFTR